jgi:hypothetical protein
MPDWLPALVMPNINMEEPVEAGELLFAPWHDSRVQEVFKVDTDFTDFMQRFTDAFGMVLRPLILLVRSDIPRERLNMSMAVTLRDALSMSVIPGAYANTLIWDRALESGYSDAFDFFPWMPGAENDGGMTALTPAQRAYHVVKEFHGQSSPLLSISSLRLKDIDWTLFNELVVRWRRKFSAAEPEWADLALFRSLDMANAAAKIPAGRDMTEYSSGRVVTNWISAFEVLIHPGPEKKVGIFDVYRHFEAVKWTNKDCMSPTHPAYSAGKAAQDRILACWIYGELFHARNDFAHGNPVDANRLRLQSGRYLHYYAAPLYRMALTGFLNLRYEKHQDKEIDTAFPNPVDLWDPQTDIERALATIHRPPKR